MAFIEKKDLGFLAYWGLTAAMRRFPPLVRLRYAPRLARLCARLWLFLSPQEREQTRRNLERMLQGRNPARGLAELNLSHHQAHIWNFLVIDLIPHLSHAQLRQLSEVRGLAHLQAARSQGRGAVLLSSHSGAHGYLTMAILVAHGCPVTAVAGVEGMAVGQTEPDHRSWLYRKLVHPMRAAPRSALPFLTRGLVPDRHMGAILQRNEALWLQGDQHLTQQEIAAETFALPVPFLWGQAVVRSGPIRLPKLFGAPVLPTFADCRDFPWVVEIEAPLPLSPGHSRAEIIADLRAYLGRLERRILAAPDHWSFTRHENLPHWIQPIEDPGNANLPPPGGSGGPADTPPNLPPPGGLGGPEREAYD